MSAKSNARIYMAVIVILIILVGIFAYVAFTPKAPVAPEKVRIAAVFPGTIEDLSWNTDAYKALLAIQKDFNVDVAFTDRVGPADWEKVGATYAAQGYNAVYLHGAEFSDVGPKLAAQYPKTFFICGVCGPYNSTLPDNMVAIISKSEQSGYVGGVVAGLLTKSGKVGIVMGFDYPMIVKVAEAFKLGAKSVNPTIQVLVVYAGTWVDPQKGKTIANAMIDQGADIIVHWADATGLGALDAAKERGVMAMGGISDQLAYAPNVVVTSAVMGVYDFVYWSLSHFIKGDVPRGTTYYYGIEQGLRPLGEWNTSIVPQSVIDQANQVIAKIKNGEIQVPVIGTPTP